MADYNTLSIVLTGIGLIVAITYYTMTLRSTNKARQRDMIIQRLQGYNLEYTRSFTDVMTMTDWDTIEEFERKYGSQTNPEMWSKYLYIMRVYNLAGILLRENMAEADLIFQLYPPMAVIRIWEQFEPLTRDRRRLRNFPGFFEPFEHLYDQAKKLHPDIVTPD